eukprot:gene10493-biopygen5081
MRFLEDQRKDVSTVRDARGFMEGPLSLCIQHELLPILGTRQVTIHVDNVFKSSLRQNFSRPIYAVPISIGLLQYISTQQELGQLVLTVVGMGRDLGKFVVVFLTSIAGFGIAFHGMFAYTPNDEDTRNFHTVEGTVLVMSKPI